MIPIEGSFYETRKNRQIQKGLEAHEKRGADLSKLNEILRMLCESRTLPAVYRDHVLLFGEYNGLHDAHISPDWILLYEIQGETILLHRTGTHSDLDL